MSDHTVIVWLRNDLRLTDNPALRAALDSGGRVLLVYILDDESAGQWAMGGASRWWLHESLASLSASVAAKGGRLVLRRGSAAAELDALIEASGASRVMWNRQYEPWAIARDTRIKASLTDRGIEVQSFNGALLHEPWQLKTGAGKPYQVFTPFWRAELAKGAPAKPLAAPRSLSVADQDIDGDTLSEWALQPTQPDWASGLRASWQPGESGAAKRLKAFLNHVLPDYSDGRDRPDQRGTSALSPHLHFGEVSARQVWHSTLDTCDAQDEAAAMAFLRELGWRDFSYNLLFHFSHLPERNLRSQFDAFPWAEDHDGLSRWQRGVTGYPIVDAGMRQLYYTGWMHNRVRMIAASFLIKHLLIDWRAGQAWFWDTLVDADLASNAASWQWVAGSGADASPYFRIFNPMTQGKKFDPNGDYVRRWVPELSGVESRDIHAPWEADAVRLAAAGVTLGKDYPTPLVDHREARERALAAFATLPKS